MPPPPPGMLPPQIVYVYPAPPPKTSLLWLWILLGVFGGVFVLGILAAIAIPSFTSYQRKAKRSEAELNLGAIEKAAKVLVIENAAFPVGEVGLTPAQSCCELGARDRKCPADPSRWSDPIWAALDFMPYEPHYFQYAYRGTATGFVATAVGDLDCDGNMATYTLEGTMVDGVPQFNLTPPTRAD